MTVKKQNIFIVTVGKSQKAVSVFYKYIFKLLQDKEISTI